MLGRDDDVLHPRILGDTRPLVCVEPRGVEAVDVLLVVRDRDVCPAHDPLPDAGNALPLVRAGGDGIGAPNFHNLLQPPRVMMTTPRRPGTRTAPDSRASS